MIAKHLRNYCSGSLIVQKQAQYPVDITVDFDEYEQTVTSGSITVQSSDTCATTAPTTANQPDKTVISVPNSQEVAQGTGIVYPIVIANSDQLQFT